jgi:hypothetical protein
MISVGILFDRAPPGGLLPVHHVVTQHFSACTYYLTHQIEKQIIGKGHGHSNTIMPMRNDSSSGRAAYSAPQAPQAPGMVLPCIRSSRNQTLLESHLNSLVGHQLFLAQRFTLIAIATFSTDVLVCTGPSRFLWDASGPSATSSQVSRIISSPDPRPSATSTYLTSLTRILVRVSLELPLAQHKKTLFFGWCPSTSILQLLKPPQALLSSPSSSTRNSHEGCPLPLRLTSSMSWS